MDNKAIQKIKFTDEEIKNLKNLQEAYQKNILKFGELNIERLSIESAIKDLRKAEEELKAEHLDIQKQEKSTLDALITKYGEGSISLSTGEFIPSKQ